MRFLRTLRERLTYANVVATLALFIALGGSSYAVLRVDSRSIVDNSVRSRDLRNDDVRGRDIKEATLKAVPRARVAGELARAERDQLVLRCPSGTRLAGGLCFDTATRSPAPYSLALSGCSASNEKGRRLPSDAELNAFIATGGQLANGGELTATLSPDPGGGVSRVVVVTGLGSYSFSTADQDHPYRCVTGPTNG